MRALALLAALGILAPHLPAPRNPYRVEVTIAERKLRLFKGDSLVVATDVAVGMNEDFTWSKNGTVKKFHFETPRGIRRVLAKEKDPLWVPPDWHFYEKAMARGLDVVELKQGERRNLSDGAFLEVRGKDVGIYDPEADLFWPWTQGLEIIIDGKIFVPPLGSSQRKVPGALGKYKLDMGDGYFIHGTNLGTQESLGQAVSHGCVRVGDEDLERLYDLVPVGTPILIR